MGRSGRPPLDDTDSRARLSFTLPSRDYDRLCREALREEISVAEVIRRRLDDQGRVTDVEERTAGVGKGKIDTSFT